MAATKSQDFPRHIYVTREVPDHPDDEPWFQVHTDGLPGDHGGELIATYDLAFVERVKVTVEAVDLQVPKTGRKKP